MDSTTVPPEYLRKYLSDLCSCSESGFKISCISDTGVSEVDKPEIIASSDPEEDALFLEHVVYDELCVGNYVTIQKTDVVGQELLPEAEI